MLSGIQIAIRNLEIIILNVFLLFGSGNYQWPTIALSLVYIPCIFISVSDHINHGRCYFLRCHLLSRLILSIEERQKRNIFISPIHTHGARAQQVQSHWCNCQKGYYIENRKIIAILSCILRYSDLFLLNF